VPRDPYGRIAPWYDLLFEPANAPLRSISLRMHEPTTSMAVLDVGCGTGADLEPYADAGSRCYGIDASPAMLRRAQDRLGDRAELTLGDAGDLPYEDAMFDLVRASLFLHELSPATRDAVVAEMARVLAPEGRMLIVDFRDGDLTTKGRVIRAVSMITERVAGREHKRNCKTFLRAGGAPTAMARAGFEIDRSKAVAGGNMGLYLLKAA